MDSNDLSKQPSKITISDLLALYRRLKNQDKVIEALSENNRELRLENNRLREMLRGDGRLRMYAFRYKMTVDEILTKMKNMGM